MGFWVLGTPLSLRVAQASDERPLKFQYVEAAVDLGALQCNSYAMGRPGLRSRRNNGCSRDLQWSCKGPPDKAGRLNGKGLKTRI
jgi:hypothetical protein